MSEALKNLDHAFNISKMRESDINEHLELLYEYTRSCDSVLELGVRDCVSTWAFLKGLMDNSSVKKRLICNDLSRSKHIDTVIAISKALECDMEFIEQDDLSLDLKEERVDLCFIDTWHVYGQLRRELAKFAPMTRKYIIMHDTEVDRVHGESMRCGLDVKKQSETTGIPVAEINTGLERAIIEFLQHHPEWIIDIEKKNNNGLTVLKRKVERIERKSKDNHKVKIL